MDADKIIEIISNDVDKYREMELFLLKCAMEFPEDSEKYKTFCDCARDYRERIYALQGIIKKIT